MGLMFVTCVNRMWIRAALDLMAVGSVLFQSFIQMEVIKMIPLLLRGFLGCRHLCQLMQDVQSTTFPSILDHHFKLLPYLNHYLAQTVGKFSPQKITCSFSNI